MLNFTQTPILINQHFHPYYRAILERARALGYTLPSPRVQTLQNNLVVYLVNKGIWAKLDILYILATDGSSDFSRLNWINPLLYELTAVNSPAFASNQGWTGNAIDSYLDSSWNPSIHGVHYTLNDASYGCKINSGSTSQSWVEMGCATLGNNISSYIHGRIAGTVGVRVNDDFTRQTAVASPVGLWHCIRDNLTSKFAYLNGALFQNSGDNTKGLPNATMTLCCLNVGGTKQSFSGRQISMAFAGSKLVSEASDLYTGWNTYQSSL
jgi:hypothetical protein